MASPTGLCPGHVSPFHLPDVVEEIDAGDPRLLLETGRPPRLPVVIVDQEPTKDGGNPAQVTIGGVVSIGLLHERDQIADDASDQ
jgi:hypothetical protein